MEITVADIFQTRTSQHLSAPSRAWVAYWFRLDHPANVEPRGDAMARYHGMITKAFEHAWRYNARHDNYCFPRILAETVEYVSNSLTYYVP